MENAKADALLIVFLGDEIIAGDSDMAKVTKRFKLGLEDARSAVKFSTTYKLRESPSCDSVLKM